MKMNICMKWTMEIANNKKEIINKGRRIKKLEHEQSMIVQFS